MQRPEDVVSILRERGEIWETSAGLIGLRGEARSLMTQLTRAIAGLVTEETDDEWIVPSGISFATLERAEYFASFPQWLTAASHLSGDEAVLASIARDVSPAKAAQCGMELPEAALSPAVCYHTYEALAGRSLESPTVMTAEGTCWRFEGDRLTPLERAWAFQMRELVCLGSATDVEAFRQRWIARASDFAASFGLESEVVLATDPFFAPTARGKAALQRIKALKHELVVRFPDGRPMAIASFNNHEKFFGEHFDISLDSGGAAASACVAFGLERWLLALLVTHGTEGEASTVLEDQSRELALAESPAGEPR